MSAFWHYIRVMVRRYRRGLVVALIFAFLSAGGLGVGLLSLGPVLELILPGEGKGTLADLAREHNADAPLVAIPDSIIEVLPTDPFAAVAMFIGLLVLLTVFGACANFIHQYLSQTITTRMVADVREEAFDHVLRLPLSRVVVRGPSEFIARMVRDAAELQRGMIALVSRSVTQLTKGAAAYLVAIVFDWRLTLTATIVAPLLAVVLRKIGKRVRRGTRGSLQAQEGLLLVATESIQGLRAVKAGCAEPAMAARFKAVNDEVVRNELRVRTARAVSGPLVEMLALAALAVLALVAARSILNGTMPLERFLLALSCLGVAGASFKPLAALANEAYAAAAPAKRLLDMTDEPVERAGAGVMPPARPVGRMIEFDAVTFAYPGAEQRALDDITLRIEAGSRVAVVGPNGSGKTTLVSLVPRLIVPTGGVVRIDGVDLADVVLTSLRSEIGVVTQETFLYRGTVAENIAFGRGGVARDDIVEAAQRARADTFIEAIPGGYDADIAEQGASLSGGQRQRISIARAILRDPRILILDEATSQIDAESESHINAALQAFCVDRTTLIIAHRLATVLHADRIIVMEGGRVVDDGTHDALLGRCGLYRRLAETQLVAAS